MENECLRCKKHYTQKGNCSLWKNNCLLFEEEPKGIRTLQDFLLEFAIYLHLSLHGSENKMIKEDEIIEVKNKKNGFETNIKIQKIIYVDLQKNVICLRGWVFECDLDFLFESNRKNKFKVIDGGKK